jgi:protein TonB
VKPRVATQSPPAYPESARQRGLQATVVLKVLVTETGLVSDVRVLRSAKVDPAFDEAAMQAVRRWTFTPGTKKGQPVACWYNVGVPFQLE